MKEVLQHEVRPGHFVDDEKWEADYDREGQLYFLSPPWPPRRQQEMGSRPRQGREETNLVR
jgi:hypothetical protein